VPTIRELEKWFTTSQAASKMGRTRQGVAWMLENRKLRAAKTQLGWLIDPESVEAFLEAEAGEAPEEEIRISGTEMGAHSRKRGSPSS
jgi:excisionase family DNA binding protein